MIRFVLGLLPLWFVYSQCGLSSIPLNPLRVAKCVVPKNVEHVSRVAFLQQCVSANYGYGNETRCYPLLGCFPMDAPWVSLKRPLPTPLPPAEIDTKLFCYTRDSDTEYQVQLWPTISLNGCPFSPNQTTIFITHGFAADSKTEWLPKMKNKLLEVEDVNVFVVDWGQGAKLMNYLQVSSNIRIVGSEGSRFLKFLIDEKGLTPGNLHLIGHSLGAQISSYFAKQVKEHKGIVARITALDPAQPAFEGEDAAVRLDQSDAEFVDVIHTNGAPFIPFFGFGFRRPIGHVDFFMNGGMMQPGCQIPSGLPKITGLLDLAGLPVEQISNWVTCSHGRACEFFIEALNKDCKIWGRKATTTRNALARGTMGLSEFVLAKGTTCDADSCIPLGLDTPKYKARGTFLATTSIHSPFCDDQATTDKILKEIGQSGDSKTPLIPKVGDAMKSMANVIKPKMDLGGFGKW